MNKKALKAVSFVLMLKSIVGGSFAAMALFGFAVPHFGIEPGLLGQGAAASVGGIVGAVLALKG